MCYHPKVCTKLKPEAAGVSPGPATATTFWAAPECECQVFYQLENEVQYCCSEGCSITYNATATP